ncbi:MAG: ABC transporter substrate-binding protein [Deltaproteobacteria bacterium]|nr:MAG: ABC transporter substrate-binding protein [Deltaproteobacteria bacterium]
MQTAALPSSALLLGLFTASMASAPARAGDSFRYAEDQAPAIVNPLFTTSMSEARLNELIFEGLYTDDKELATTPQLVERDEVSEDRTSMTLTLRQGVRWHDGTPFTADDVVFTINAMKDRKTLSTEKGRVEWIKSARAIDDRTVVLQFERPEARPQDKLFFKILPAHRFDGTAVKRSDPFRTAPIGTGPFRLESYNEDGSITLSRVADHRDGPRLPEIVMREVSDKNYQAKLLLYESLEALVRVLPRDLAVLQNNRAVELYPYQTNSWWYLGFNLDRAPWDNRDLREAIAHLVDVEALLAPIGTGDTLTGPFVKSSPFYNHDVRPWGYEPGVAASLLQRAGYERDGDRWVRDGQPLTLRISAHKSLESAQEVVINLQSQLQSQGIAVEVDFLDEASWRSRVWADQDYDLVLSQWSFDRNEDIREQFYSNGARNFTGYSNPDVDALLDLARDTLNPQEKKQALREVHLKVHDDLPMIFLWTLDSYSAMSVKVRDVVIHPFYFFTWASDWSMD